MPTLTIDRDTFTCNDINQTFTITLTATDSDGNTASCSSQVTIQQGTDATCDPTACNGFSISVPTTNETIAGANNGVATVIANGGSGSFTYQWVNSSNQIFSTSAAVSGLAPGAYTVTVRDAADPNNCVIVGAVNITAGPVPIDCDLTVSYPTLLNETVAGANDGAATAMGSSTAFAAFTYVWFDMGGNVIGTNAGVSGLAPGNYAVLVQAAQNIACTIRDTITIAPGPIGCNIGVNVTVVDETVVGASNGSATAQGTGASGNYTFVWVDTAGNILTTPTIASLAPGTYTVTVRDALDATCSITQQVVVSTSPPVDPCNIGLTFSNIIAESVVGANDGSAIAQGTGASGNYSYTWVNSSGVIVGVTAGMSNLPPDVYSVTVRDAVDQNCATVVTVTIEPGQPAMVCNIGLTFPTIIAESVAGANDGTATAQGSGGSGQYTYTWARSNGTLLLGNNLATRSGLAPDTYSVTVRDMQDINCVTVAQVTIGVRQPVTTTCTIGLTFPIIMAETVAGANDGTATAQGTGVASGNYQYTWVNSNGVIVATTATASNLPPDVYSVTVRDAGNVSCVTVITVTIEPGPVVSTDLVLGGRILHPNGIAAITNANVNLSGGLTTSTNTNTTGNYAFNVAQGGSYTITPFEDTNFNNGGNVDLVDVQEIQAHIVRNDPLDNHYELIAADADRNGVIESRDLSHIIRTALLNVPFPNNTSWRFIPTNFTFPAFMDFGSPVAGYPETRFVSNMQVDNLNQDFIGVKIGDVATSFATSPFRGGASSRAAFQFVVKDQQLSAGELISVPIKANQFNDLLGYQMTLATNNSLQLEKVVPGAIADITMNNFGQNEATEDISTLWVSAFSNSFGADEVLFTLQFRVHTDGQLLSEVLDITSDKISAYGLRGDFSDTSIGLVFEEADIENGVFELYQNRPNPFKTLTTVGFNLPERGQATLRIYDLSGRQVHRVENEFAKGYNEVQIQSEVLPSTGILYYELEAAGQIARRKMILIE